MLSSYSFENLYGKLPQIKPHLQTFGTINRTQRTQDTQDTKNTHDRDRRAPVEEMKQNLQLNNIKNLVNFKVTTYMIDDLTLKIPRQLKDDVSGLALDRT